MHLHFHERGYENEKGGAKDRPLVPSTKSHLVPPTRRHYTTTSPTTHTWVTLVDLCTANVHVTSTRAPSGLQSTGSWATDEGVQVATNGDFYATGPVRVCGNAVGRGLAWPLDQTGDDPGYSLSRLHADAGLGSVEDQLGR